MVNDDFMTDLIKVGVDEQNNALDNKADTEKLIDVISTKITNQLSSKIDEITKKVDELQKTNNEKEIKNNDNNNENEQGNE